ncbi:MAG: hypothetical protein V3T49_07640, partial [Dehalococcoidia bacterium]
AAQSGTTETAVTTTDNSVRIDEIHAAIAVLEADAAALVAAKNAEKDDLAAEIDSIKATYDQLVADARAAFEATSADLLAQAAVIGDQIADLEAVGGDDANAQIALLQPSYDGLIAFEQSEEDAFHTQEAQYNADEDAALAGPKAAKDAVEAELVSGLTDAIDAEIAGYNAELATLQTESVDTTTTTTAVDTATVDEILASIAAVEAHWNSLIDEATNQKFALENELLVGSTNDSNTARINSLRLQAAELERILQVEITNLEALVNELYRQADSASSGDNGRFAELQSQIDNLNAQLEEIWRQESTSGLDVLRQVQELEKQARALEEENEQATRRLEEEVWDLDDRMNAFWRNQETGNTARQDELEAESQALQAAMLELQDRRWALDTEQRVVFDQIEQAQQDAHNAIRLIEEEQYGALREQMRAVELELREFYGQQRAIEDLLRDAQSLVEEKKRELEDKVFDALEAAAGTVDEAGEAVLTATEEVPVIEEPAPTTVVEVLIEEPAPTTVVEVPVIEEPAPTTVVDATETTN